MTFTTSSSSITKCNTHLKCWQHHVYILSSSFIVFCLVLFLAVLVNQLWSEETLSLETVTTSELYFCLYCCVLMSLPCRAERSAYKRDLVILCSTAIVRIAGL